MKIHLGYNDYLRKKEHKDVAVIWDTAALINPHMILCGKSGTGKSYTLINYIEQISDDPDLERYHNLDLHRDLIIRGESRVEFSGATRYGYNPLVLDTNPASGGVRRQINFLISTINQTARKIMDKQEAALRNLLTDVYALHGIFEDHPETWCRKEITEAKRREIWDGRRFSELKEYYPTLDDLIGYAERRLKAMYGGLDANELGSKAVGALEEMNKAAARMNSASSTYNRKTSVEDREKAGKAFDNAKAKFLDRVNEYANSLETGREFELLIKYDSKEVLKGVIDRLKNFKAIGIFNANPPPFDPRAKVWSYDLSNLSTEEQIIFCNLRAQHVFRKRKLAGPIPYIAEILGADEAHLLFDDKDPDNVFNKIAKEARKFGLGLWGAAQTPSDFPEEIITTVSTKILLGIDSYYWQASCKKLNISEDVLKYITPHSTIAVYMDKKGALNSRFNNVQLK